MAVRSIQIEITGQGGQYEATVNKIIEKNRQLTTGASRGQQQLQQQLARTTGGMGGIVRNFQQANLSAGNFNRTVDVLRVSLVQLTGATGAAGASLVNLLRFGLNPVVIVITAIAVALGLFISRKREATRQAEAFAQALKSQEQQIASSNIELAVLTGHITEVEGAVQEFVLSQAEGLKKLEDRVESLRNSWGQWVKDLLLNAPLIGRAFSFLGEMGFGIRPDVFGDKRLAEAEERVRKAEETRDVRIQQIREKFAAQQAKAANERARREIESAIEQVKKMSQALEMEAVALIDGAAAVEEYKLKQVEANIAKALGVEGARQLIDALREQGQANRTLADSIQFRNQIAEQAHQREIERQNLETAATNARMGAERRAREHEIAKLQAGGGSEIEVLQRRIELRRQEEELLRNLPVLTIEQAKRHEELRKQLELDELALMRLQSVTINVGEHIANTFTTIFNSLISGTLKSVDLVRAAVGTVGNIVTDIFRQVITKKLAFEQTLFTNVQGLPGQMSQALGSGGGGGGTGGFGNFLQHTFGGGTTGAGGGFFESIGRLFGLGGGSGAGGTLGMGGLLGRAGIGGLIGSAVGGGGLGGTLGGTLGALAFPTLANAGLSASLGTAAAFGGSTLAGTVFGSLIMPGIGAIVGALLGSLVGGLFKKKPRRIMFGLPAGQTVGSFFEDPQLAFRQRTVTQSQAELIARTVGEGVEPFQQRLPSLFDAERQRALEFELPELTFSTRNRRHVQALADQFARDMQAALLQAFSQGIGLEFLSQEQLFGFLEIRDPIRQSIQELEVQLRVLGKTTEEALKIRREFELSQLALANLTQAQVDHLAAVMQQRDALQVELERQRLAVQTREQLKSQTEEMKLQLAMLGQTLEEQQAIRREFELRKLAEQGIFGDMSLQQLQQLGDLTTKGLGAAALIGGGPAGNIVREMEERDRIARELAREQQFSGLRENLERQLEDLQHEAFARDLSPEERDVARRELELGRLTNLNDDQLDVLRKIMEGIDALRRELEGPRAHFDIHLTSQDPEEIARRLQDLLISGGKLSPPN